MFDRERHARATRFFNTSSAQFNPRRAAAVPTTPLRFEHGGPSTIQLARNPRTGKSNRFRTERRQSGPDARRTAGTSVLNRLRPATLASARRPPSVWLCREIEVCGRGVNCSQSSPTEIHHAQQRPSCRSQDVFTEIRTTLRQLRLLTRCDASSRPRRHCRLHQSWQTRWRHRRNEISREVSNLASCGDRRRHGRTAFTARITITSSPRRHPNRVTVTPPGRPASPAKLPPTSNVLSVNHQNNEPAAHPPSIAPRNQTPRHWPVQIKIGIAHRNNSRIPLVPLHPPGGFAPEPHPATKNIRPTIHRR